MENFSQIRSPSEALQNSKNWQNFRDLLSRRTNRSISREPRAQDRTINKNRQIFVQFLMYRSPKFSNSLPTMVARRRTEKKSPTFFAPPQLEGVAFPILEKSGELIRLAWLFFAEFFYSRRFRGRGIRICGLFLKKIT